MVRKFNLLNLVEGERYIKDFYASKIRLYDFSAKEYREIEAKNTTLIHLSTQSIIIEHPGLPLYRYQFKHVSLSPELVDEEIQMEATKVVEIPQAPRPYIVHEQPSEGCQLAFSVDYQETSEIHSAIQDLISNEHADLVSKYSFASSEQQKFNQTWTKSSDETISLESRATYILPLVDVDGIVCITNARIYFQPRHEAVLPKQVVNIKLDEVKQVLRRRYTLMDVGLEVKAEKANKQKEKSMYLVFASASERDKAYQSILANLPNPGDCFTTEKDINQYTQQWSQGKLTNYEYLMILNLYAQRSFNDLTQYPVMPWVLKDYTSEVLDLQNLASFRDLAKPIGALGDPKRLAEARERYSQTPEDCERFLYGTHYSCPGYVVGFHVRSHPHWMIKFQSGKFDNPNRLFKGIEEEWIGCLTAPANVKELIPEFFMPECTDMLLNTQNLDLGTRANGERVEDVELPKWAASPEDFLEQHRLALESPYVSSNLHQWIDLIFGCKQNSIEADNVFHPYSYEGHIDFEAITDPQERRAYEDQIREFGQTPKQLFVTEHLKKGTEIELRMTADAKIQEMDGSNQPPARKYIIEEQSSLSAAPENDTAQLQSLLSNPDAQEMEAQRLPDGDDQAEEQQPDSPGLLNGDMQAHDLSRLMSEGRYVNRGRLDRVEALAQNQKLLECLRKPEVTQVILVEDLASAQGSGRVPPLSSSAKPTASTQMVITTSDGFIKRYVMNRAAPEPSFALTKSYMIHASGITAACQVLLISKLGSTASQSSSFYPDECFACSSQTNDIHLFSFATGTCLSIFYAHDDLISSLMFVGQKLVSTSFDQTIRVWDLRQPVMTHKAQIDDHPITIFDHHSSILSGDILRSASGDHRLATLDMSGQILIRSLKVFDEAAIEEVLHRITLGPSVQAYLKLQQANQPDQIFLRLLFNQDRQLQPTEACDFFLLVTTDHNQGAQSSGAPSTKNVSALGYDLKGHSVRMMMSKSSESELLTEFNAFVLDNMLLNAAIWATF